MNKGNKSFYRKYVLPGLLITGICMSSLHMYGVFLVDSAYQEKRYDDVMKYTRIFAHVSSYVVDTAIKSLLEKQIDSISKHEYIFDPLQKNLAFSYNKLNKEIGIKGKTPMQRFAQSIYDKSLSKKYEAIYTIHLPTVYYELSSLLNHHVRVRKQKQYNTSCYLYPLKKYTREYINSIKRCIYCIQEFKDKDSIQIFQKNIATYDSIINDQLKISNTINIYNIDENCWDEMQKELLLGISEIDQFLNTNIKLPLSIEKELYTGLKSFSITLYQGVEALEKKYSLTNHNNQEMKKGIYLIIKKYDSYFSQK